MSRKMVDLSGRKFGRLLVLHRSKNKRGSPINFLCKCSCGNLKIVTADSLKRHHHGTQSCGCLVTDTNRFRCTTHGMSKTRIYRIWCKMISRCENKNIDGWRNYGARGISICKAWHKFESFYDWSMVNGYQQHLEIERKDNNGNYEPENCKWATKKEQANNRRTNIIIEFKGKHQTLQQWSEEVGITPYTIHRRIFQFGWTVEKALHEKIRQQKRAQV